LTGGAGGGGGKVDWAVIGVQRGSMVGIASFGFESFQMLMVLFLQRKGPALHAPALRSS
jgi:hypothetical protein